MKEFFSVQEYSLLIILDVGGENATQELKLEDIEIKEETVFIKEKDPLGSNEEDTCTVYVQGESLKRESTDIHSET